MSSFSGAVTAACYCIAGLLSSPRVVVTMTLMSRGSCAAIWPATEKEEEAKQAARGVSVDCWLTLTLCKQIPVNE